MSDRVHQEFLGKDKFLEVGFTLDGREVILNYPADQGQPAGHIIFSPAQARNLARILIAKADGCVP
jgi:hypothetical protein